MRKETFMKSCTLCPRECRIDRESGTLGYCGVGSEIYIARSAPHYWEEPCLSGTNGVGAVFFSGCSLRCVYCQNYEVSHSALGRKISDGELYENMLSLARSGVHCLDLVTPTHYTDRLVPLLERLRGEIGIPIVWNSSGYEKVETLRGLDGLVDIYLPDFKYASGELAARYSDAPDYPDVAAAALAEMHRQVGKAVFDNEGMMKKGVIVRHLVLPGCRRDSVAVLHKIAETVDPCQIKLSLMSQYTPDFAKNSPFRELHRRITTFEYDSILKAVDELGFDGWFQERSSADKKYTPDFE